MFDDVNLGSKILANPAMIQGLVLTELQNRLNGVYSAADPNNAFNIQLEAASSMNAQTVRYMESAFASQYAVRATTSAELYNNMSDYDYLNMVATPSETVLNLTFNSDYLIANAISYDSTYNRIVIPAISQFYVGPLTFSIYYPINININKTTNNFNVLWDTTTTNPLTTLESNMVPFSQYSYGGLNLITLQIPVSQFAMTTTTYSVVSSQGFIQTISYTDQFYAVRVFTNLPTGSWTELSYTLSETVYDPTTPTAKINIQNDTNTVIVSIPQIYFTNSQIGNQVQVVLCTTKGEVTLDLTSVEISNCNVSFGIGQSSVTSYSSILANLSTIDLTPNETVITGGSNALTFTQLRNLIVNGGLYTNAPVTPAQLDAFASKNGFTITKYLDNVTDRIYFASSTITGGQNGTIMVTTGNVNVTSTAADATSTILSFPSYNSITILPTTIYSYNDTTNVCTPLTDTQVTYLTGLTGQSFVDELNTNSYVKCPFHLVTFTSSQYPLTKSYNLMNPTITNINFVTDNVLLTPQMSVSSGVVIHNNNGTGGYTIRLGVVKNTAMQAISETDITVCLTTTDEDGNVLYGIATLTGTTTSLYIYEMNVPTSYYISETDTFETTLSQVSSVETTVNLPLASTFNVVFLINQSLYPTVTQNSQIIENLPTEYSSMLGVSLQSMLVTFGTDLSNQVYNITNATWSSTTYATYPTTVYSTYTQNQYLTNSSGGLVYDIVNGTVQLTQTAKIGDPITTVIGSDLPYIINSSTSITITLPSKVFPDGTALSSSSIGRMIGINNLTTLNSASGVYAITAVSGTDITLAVTGYPSSGTGVCTAGLPITQYLAGSIKLDPYGNPITMSSRTLQYYVTSIMFDLRLFYSQNTEDIAFVSGLTSTLDAYFETIDTMQDQLLEQTQLYYVPNTTMGTAVFSSGNNTPITLNLGFTFSLTAYVSQSTLSNTVLQTTIKEDIQTIIQAEMSNSIISLTNIATNIMSELSDVIDSIDVDGIDSNVSLQTVIVPSGTTSPMIAQELFYDANTGIITLQPAITINFVLAE